MIKLTYVFSLGSSRLTVSGAGNKDSEISNGTPRFIFFDWRWCTYLFPLIYRCWKIGILIYLSQWSYGDGLKPMVNYLVTCYIHIFATNWNNVVMVSRALCLYNGWSKFNTIESATHSFCTTALLDVFYFWWTTTVIIEGPEYLTLTPRWRHQIETFSALLALCEGNPPVTGAFSSQRSVTRSFDVFFICA